MDSFTEKTLEKISTTSKTTILSSQIDWWFFHPYIEKDEIFPCHKNFTLINKKTKTLTRESESMVRWDKKRKC